MVPYLACFLRCRWLPELAHHCPEVPVIIVGTKTDIREEGNPKHVTSADGEALAKKSKSAYVECSAKSMDNVNGVFDVAIRYVLCSMCEYASVYTSDRSVLTPNKKKGRKGAKCILL